MSTSYEDNQPFQRPPEEDEFSLSELRSYDREMQLLPNRTPTEVDNSVVAEKQELYKAAETLKKHVIKNFKLANAYLEKHRKDFEEFETVANTYENTVSLYLLLLGDWFGPLGELLHSMNTKLIEIQSEIQQVTNMQFYMTSNIKLFEELLDSIPPDGQNYWEMVYASNPHLYEVMRADFDSMATSDPRIHKSQLENALDNWLQIKSEAYRLLLRFMKKIPDPAPQEQLERLSIGRDNLEYSVTEFVNELKQGISFVRQTELDLENALDDMEFHISNYDQKIYDAAQEHVDDMKHIQYLLRRLDDEAKNLSTAVDPDAFYVDKPWETYYLDQMKVVEKLLEQNPLEELQEASRDASAFYRDVVVPYLQSEKVLRRRKRESGNDDYDEERKYPVKKP